MARFCCFCCCTRSQNDDADAATTKTPISEQGGDADQEEDLETGNLRNKYALAPGHSLMDWIRLGSSGKDLTGVGSQAGNLSVTPSELALHNKETDAWLCIRGRVYNVTAYLPFHPGGPEQLMKGAGKDATRLFEEVHPWVNFDQILTKCYVGKLKAHPEFEPEEVFKSEKNAPPPPQNNETVANATKEPILLPRFDWIQKLDYITIIFYTGNFSNPMLETTTRGDDNTHSIFLTYNNTIFDNEIVFAGKVHFPGRIKVTCETGKVELCYKKCQGSVWDNFGVLKQKARPYTDSLVQAKLKCKVVNKIKVNYNTVLIELERSDNTKSVVPLGKHIKVFDTIKGEEIVRSYTPVPICLFSKFRQQNYTTDNICLMVKRYPEGNLSKILGDCLTGDTVTISKPLGSFNLQEIEKRETFIILAAGTGITPMFAIILFLLERRIRKCQRLRLLFFNRTPDDIPFRTQFEELQREEPRFKVFHVLSQADNTWTGLRGHVSRSILEETIADHLKDTTYVKSDVYFMVCGPTIFTTLTQQLFKDLQFKDEQIHFFLG
ncbi:cytochrome b5 reductase 4 isoform X2 [Tribolium castaneum]|uniref:cytochrome b5 reductase 4 isoform X2 n=1 Tax=Tribolium castaneum TaxID=7070 RepID=UPI00046C0CFA|nr:PREDICTED: cytochrome b5 reductase 4 isoform X1 [Tribolium castaneum]|eukprot:XP_008197358.1 PREDICTED: cytochrome b5 reductase 4 isoform X1 [Tribolium castaneum]